jgi:hypothetical protein
MRRVKKRSARLAEARGLAKRFIAWRMIAACDWHAIH